NPFAFPPPLKIKHVAPEHGGSTLIFISLLQPFVSYRVLHQDSLYWQGLLPGTAGGGPWGALGLARVQGAEEPLMAPWTDVPQDAVVALVGCIDNLVSGNIPAAIAPHRELFRETEINTRTGARAGA
ncbi:unnamed protein product, partial [Discosporangium mesarthrocarpum]